MNWKKAIIFGVLIWVLMFVIVSVLLGYYNRYDFVKVIIAVVAGILSYLLAGKVKPNTLTLALGYGFIWVVVGVVLDSLIIILITMQFNKEIFGQWSLWLRYILILLAPTLQVKKIPGIAYTNKNE